MAKLDDLTGKNFGKLTVIKRDKDYVGRNGQRQTQWLCLCECGNKVTVRAAYLKDGRTKSCGCLRREATSVNSKQYNTYDLSGEYGVGYTSNTNEPFYFDLEDYNKIKNYCWYKDKYGYVSSNIYNNGKKNHIKLHMLVMNTDSSQIIDHIYHNKLDNRKSALRPATQSTNQMNVGVRSNNTTGVTGVYHNKNTNKWFARIKINQNIIHLGTFDSFDDAVKARKNAEEKYFGEFSYDNSMRMDGII